MLDERIKRSMTAARRASAVLTLQPERKRLCARLIAAFHADDQQTARELSETRDELARIGCQLLLATRGGRCTQ